ncbi:hypothetical protein HMPREF2087_01359 [Helicobacter canis NCTC 12740]|uniref:Uncharacterized protein n=1 Tax=Helicobacter canis NCTC 12740 TaxID=1357399 RepID=V8CIY8_9HELI|nr:hypothetical protein HMPREF2087_01359 [Helicobacter canis NCTC 12740]
MRSFKRANTLSSILQLYAFSQEKPQMNLKPYYGAYVKELIS